MGAKQVNRPESPGAVADAGQDFRLDFGQRLTWVLDRFESRADAGKVAGVIPDQLSKYVRGGAKPMLETMARLCEASGTSLDWLASGRGNRLVAGADEHGSDWLLVPVYKIEASSGHGAFPSGEELRDPVKFPRTTLRRLASASIDQLSVVFNRGDSNEPDIMDGDAMLIDRGIERLIDDAFYVFNFDEALLVKLIERLMDGRVALKSRNTNYREEVLSREDAGRLTVFGRVVWRGGLV